MDPITLAIIGLGALGLGYWAFVKKGLSGVSLPGGSAAPSKAGGVVTPETVRQGTAVSTLQQMVNAVPLNPDGSLQLSPAMAAQTNEIVKYMRANPSSRATMPAAVATRVVGNGIDPLRTA